MLLGSNQQGNSVTPEAGNDGLLERPHLLVVEVNII
jgi:hypothetical protein